MQLGKEDCMANGNEAERQLASFIAKYTPEIGALAWEIRAHMRAKFPTALELVYDNYNALAIGFGPSERTSEAIFAIALYPRWVSLFFLQARGLPDPDKALRGGGTTAKHVVLTSADSLEHPPIRNLMEEATARANVPFSQRGAHRLIIKSVSTNQRPRRPAINARIAASSVRMIRPAPGV
jgi:hypothetical protein